MEAINEADRKRASLMSLRMSLTVNQGSVPGWAQQIEQPEPQLARGRRVFQIVDGRTDIVSSSRQKAALPGEDGAYPGVHR
jgi:cell division FtsZ-interacting protein ZapD